MPILCNPKQHTSLQPTLGDHVVCLLVVYPCHSLCSHLSRAVSWNYSAIGPLFSLIFFGTNFIPLATFFIFANRNTIHQYSSECLPHRGKHVVGLKLGISFSFFLSFIISTVLPVANQSGVSFIFSHKWYCTSILSWQNGNGFI